jgi:hypothetical protein
MVGPDALREDLARLDFQQRSEAFRSNKRSRDVTNVLRLVAGVVGVVIIGAAAFVVLSAGSSAKLDVKAIAAAGMTGGTLLGTALRFRPPDLEPSRSNPDADPQPGLDDDGGAGQSRSAGVFAMLRAALGRGRQT